MRLDYHRSVHMFQEFLDSKNTFEDEITLASSICRSVYTDFDGRLHDKLTCWPRTQMSILAWSFGMLDMVDFHHI